MFDRSSFAKKHFQRLLVLLDPEQPPPYQLKDELWNQPTHFKNYKCSKILCFSPNSRDFSKILLNDALPIFGGHTRIKQHSPT